MALPELYANNFATTLAVAITTTGATSITVAGTAPAALQLAGQFRVVIDSEILIVTAGASTTTWTVARGAEGTTAATHANSAPVTHVLTAASGKLLNGVANVKSSDFGAVGGAKIVTDAAITATQNTVTSAQAAFTNADVGKFIYIEGAGANIPNTSPTLQDTMIAKISSVAGGVATLTTTGGGAITATTTVSVATAYFGVDDSAAFAAALAAGPVYVPTDNYLWASAITITSTDVQFFGDGFGQSVILAPASNTFSAASHLLVRGTIGANVTVAADVAAGATSFTTSTNPSLKTGDYLALTDGSNTLNTWPGGASNSACRGEMLRVQSVTGAGPFTVTVTGVIQDQYQVNNAARMNRLAMLQGVRLENVEFRCTTPYTLLTDTSPMVWLEWCVDPYTKIRVRGNPGSGFQAGGCWDGDFYIDAEDLKDGGALGTPASLNWWGYGAWASLCDRDCRYFINAKRVRHAFTTGGQSATATPGVHYGVPRSIQVNGAASDTTNAAWDTHADAMDIHFGQVDAHGCQAAGVQVRAPNTTIGDAKVNGGFNAGIVISHPCTQDTVTTNGAIALSAGVATTSGQASGVVLVTSTTAGLAALPSAGVITAGGVAIKYTSRATGTLSGCTCQAVASGTILTASTVLVTNDTTANVQSHAVGCHVKSLTAHDMYAGGGTSGKGVDCYAPYATVDSAYIHDVSGNAVYLRATSSHLCANPKGFKFNGRIINPGFGSGGAIFFEGAPAGVVLEGQVDLANNAISASGTTPASLNTSGLACGPGVTHPAADNNSAHGYGISPIPVGRTNSRMGESTLASGTVTVSNANVTTSTEVLVFRKTAGGTMGVAFTFSVTAGTSFTINSVSAANAVVTTDTSVVVWVLVEKGAT